MKLLKCTILLASLVLCTVGCEKRDKEQDVYAFGVAAPFSGQEGVAVYGQNIKKAVEWWLAPKRVPGKAPKWEPPRL